MVDSLGVTQHICRINLGIASGFLSIFILMILVEMEHKPSTPLVLVVEKLILVAQDLIPLAKFEKHTSIFHSSQKMECFMNS